MIETNTNKTLTDMIDYEAKILAQQEDDEFGSMEPTMEPTEFNQSYTSNYKIETTPEEEALLERGRELARKLN